MRYCIMQPRRQRRACSGRSTRRRDRRLFLQCWAGNEPQSFGTFLRAPAPLTGFTGPKRSCRSLTRTTLSDQAGTRCESRGALISTVISRERLRRIKHLTSEANTLSDVARMYADNNRSAAPHIGLRRRTIHYAYRPREFRCGPATGSLPYRQPETPLNPCFPITCSRTLPNTVELSVSFAPKTLSAVDIPMVYSAETQSKFDLTRCSVR
jgi:hypothetical protein